VSSDAPAHLDLAGRDKLPVVATCIAGYRAVYDEWDSLVRLAAWPFIWLVAAQLAGKAIAAVFSDSVGGLVAVLSYLVVIPFAVSWLRTLILGQKPLTFEQVRIGRTEVKFLAYSLLIPLVSYLPAFAFGAVVIFLKRNTQLLPLVAILLALSAGAYVSLRLWLVCPEIAIDVFQHLRSSWQKTHGAVSRIFAIALLMELPLIIIGIPVAMFVGFFQTATVMRLMAGDIMQILLGLLSSAVYRAAQAIVYKHLTKGQTGISAA